MFKIIIPCRLHSTRLPKKLLLPLGEGAALKPLFCWAVDNAIAAVGRDNVIVATDALEIYNEALKRGYKVVMTSESCRSGTQRVFEAIEAIKAIESEPSDENIDQSPAPIFINIQADEPFLSTEILKDWLEYLSNLQKLNKLTNPEQSDAAQAMMMSTLVAPISYEHAQDFNTVKTVLDHKQRALYFSRLAIPHSRDGIVQNEENEENEELHSKNNYRGSYWGHIGAYAYTYETLKYLFSKEEVYLEKQEKLEQLKALYYNVPIYCMKVATMSLGIDTEEDYNSAKRLVKS